MLLAESLLGSSSTAANYIEDVFSTYLYAGNGSTQTITNGIDLSTKGGLVWIKSRSDTNSHGLWDTSRGVGTGSGSTTNKALSSNSTAAQGLGVNAHFVSSFNATGFSVDVGTSVLAGNRLNNQGGVNYASWTFRKQAKFFDVVTWTGDGVLPTVVSHNLGSVPACIIAKRTDAVGAWYVYHKNLRGGSLPYLSTLYLNTTDAAQADGNWLLTDNPTASTFSVTSNFNANGGTYVAYLFAHDAGGFGATGTDNVISCGSFTTDGSGNATVTLGYEPQWCMFKRAVGGTGNWIILDNMRGWPVGGNDSNLLANLTNAEASASNQSDPNATGFSVAGISINSTYIYIAIRRGPMKTPTTGTSVFALAAQSDGVGGAALAGSTNSFVNQRPDLSVFANRAGNAKNFQFANLLTGYQQTTGPGADTLTTPTLSTSSTAAQATSGNAIYVLPANGSNPPEVRFSSDSVGAKIGYIFRRAPGFFDVVCYTGTGSVATVNHNLSVAPELMIVKRRSGVGLWAVYSAALGATKYLSLNTTDASTTDVIWNDTAPTSSVFTVYPYTATGSAGATYVAYLFATVAGVSKVGSYTGTGTTKQIDCGFTGGARFVLIKRTDSTGDWYVWDSARGIVSGNDSYLLLNSTAAEVTNTDYVDTYSAGFEISSTAPAAINANGGSFIFFAVA